MTRKQPSIQSAARSSSAQPERGKLIAHHHRGAPPTVSGRWLLKAASLSLLAATGLGWLTLCLLFWQGSWQLLYHPESAITRTPASMGLPFDPVAFAATGAGLPRLQGWWIPSASGAPQSRYTVLYLHGQTGNLSNTVDGLAVLHAADVNVFAFDYRGYGQSQFAHPSEARWREDADLALDYLTSTRHIVPAAIVLDGKGLGGNLALEVAAAHPNLAGVVVESPLDAPVNAIFNDPRAHMVPSHLLVRDRFDAMQAANSLLIPSLWVIPPPAFKNDSGRPAQPEAYTKAPARKTLVWLPSSANAVDAFGDAFRRWLDDLPQTR